MKKDRISLTKIEENGVYTDVETMGHKDFKRKKTSLFKEKN